jgi:3-oxoacyl-[acyl-carrier protein] reductase
MYEEFRGKTAVVTGAASGIGAAIGRALLDQGARVAMLVIDEDAVGRMALESDDATAIAADVSDADQVDAAFRRVAEMYGPPDHVVHAAGVDDPAVKQLVADQLAKGEPIDVTSGMTNQSWRRMISINLDGSFHVLSATLREMYPRRSGTIVLIGSESAVHGISGLSHYSASKGGVHSLIRSVAVEAIHQGVRINGIAPGVIDTPLSRRSPAGLHGAATQAVAPIGRKGRPEEIADVALFLLSQHSSYIVGEIVNVDGGRTAS